MWVLNQDKDVLVKIDNAVIGVPGAINENQIHCLMGEGSAVLGKYSSQENAKFVLHEMYSHIVSYARNPYEMPNDETVSAAVKLINVAMGKVIHSSGGENNG